MRNKIGITCMGLGTALVLAALSLFLWNRHEARMAQASVSEILPQVIQRIEAPETQEVRTVEADVTVEAPETLPDPYDPAMTVSMIEGYDYIGYLSIPALELELPVMADWDYERLKLSPCRYAGSTKTDDLVIAAHNYVQHFGSLSTLQVGDTVYFVDMDGVLTAYAVAAMEVLSPTAVEEMTAGNYDLTLFTCTYGGQSRVTVRCDRTVTDAPETQP